MKNLRKLDKFRVEINHPFFHVPEKDKHKEGVFQINSNSSRYSVIASTGEGWDHVSISGEYSLPTHEVMADVKGRFFNDGEVAVEYHPLKKDYVNNHPNCLHIWRPTEQKIPTPNFYEFEKEQAEQEGQEEVEVDGKVYTITYKKALGFERIGVTSEKGTPSWETMCKVKNYYFGDQVIVQYHPRTIDPKLDKNNTLFLWKSINEPVPVPPPELVGSTELTPEDFENKNLEELEDLLISQTNKIIAEKFTDLTKSKTEENEENDTVFSEK